MKQNRTLSALAVFVSAVLWGTYGSFVTVISAEGLGRNIMQVFRFGVTALTVCVIMLVRDRSMFRVRKEDRILFLLNGFASILFFTTCYTMAIQETKIATAAALLYTAPAIVLVLSAILFREKVNGKKVVCILLSILGCAFVSGIAGGASGLTARGLLLGLGAGLGYALYRVSRDRVSCGPLRTVHRCSGLYPLHLGIEGAGILPGCPDRHHRAGDSGPARNDPVSPDTLRAGALRRRSCGGVRAADESVRKTLFLQLKKRIILTYDYFLQEGGKNDLKLCTQRLFLKVSGRYHAGF